MNTDKYMNNPIQLPNTNSYCTQSEYNPWFTNLFPSFWNQRVYQCIELQLLMLRHKFAFGLSLTPLKQKLQTKGKENEQILNT